VRARTWYGEFRELVLMCVVHNTKRSLKQWNQATSGDSPRPNAHLLFSSSDLL